MIVLANDCKLDNTTKCLVARAFEDSIRKFFDEPENVKKFEEWKKKQKSEEKK